MMQIAAKGGLTMKKCIFVLLSTLVGLSGCTSVEGLRPDIAARPVPSGLDEVAYINVLRSAFVVQNATNTIFGSPDQALCFKGDGLKPFRSKSAQGYAATKNLEDKLPQDTCITYKQVPDNQAGKAELRNYLTAGFGLTDIYCQRFFTVANASEQNRKFGRSFASGVDVLVSSILTLSGAGEVPVGIANAGFGLVDKTFEGYDAAYLVAPDMSNVRKLVLAAQDQYRKQALDMSLPAFPTGFASSRSVIERYAGICTYSGMRELINKSLKDKTDEINAGQVKDAANESNGNDGKPPITKKPEAPKVPQPIVKQEPRVLETPVPQG
jgi:hypothetical protein